jgi:hypothetical protein
MVPATVCSETLPHQPRPYQETASLVLAARGLAIGMNRYDKSVSIGWRSKIE